MAKISYLEYSNRDFKYANDMFKCENYDPCGRLCQQTVEKRLKHYIEHNGNGRDKLILLTHNLGVLYERVCELASVAVDNAVVGQLSRLTRYYFDTNYPKEEGNIELTKEMAVEALEVALRTNDWVDQLMNEGE